MNLDPKHTEITNSLVGIVLNTHLGNYDGNDEQIVGDLFNVFLQLDAGKNDYFNQLLHMTFVIAAFVMTYAESLGVTEPDEVMSMWRNYVGSTGS